MDCFWTRIKLIPAALYVINNFKFEFEFRFNTGSSQYSLSVSSSHPITDYNCPDSKVHGANMGPIWGRQDPGGPHVGPMNFIIWVITMRAYNVKLQMYKDPEFELTGKLHSVFCEYSKKTDHILSWLYIHFAVCFDWP